MMPGATPVIAGQDQARAQRRTCRALGLCQARTPACLDCPAKPEPTAGLAANDNTQADPYPLPGAGHQIDPESDDNLGLVIAATAVCVGAIAVLAIIGGGVLAGMAWAWLGLP